MFDEPKRIQKLLDSYSGNWMIAGGWGIDLFLNKETRNHHDIEIAIPRKDQNRIKEYLKSWDIYYIQKGEKKIWKDHIELILPIHEIHCYKREAEIEILLNEFSDDKWVFRRNPKIEYPMESVILKSEIGIPILSPEIILLYKAKNIKEKDNFDFQNIISKLETKKRNWLFNSISETYGFKHQWIEKIT